MAKVSVVDEWITTEDGAEIFTKTWKTKDQPVATLVMIHGFGEHIARYDRTFTAFANNGIECYGYDQRGWGETGKKSGHYGNNEGYDTVLKDVDNAVLKMRRDKIPLFLMGHSMGGGIVLNYVSRKNTYKGVNLIAGTLACSPLVTLSLPIPTIKNYGLRIVSCVIPKFVIQAGLSPEGISHDQEEIRKYKEDPLIHDFATLNTLKSFIDAGSDILKTQAKLIECPLLVSHGDADPINDYQGSVKAYELASSKDKEMKGWPGLYHELQNETAPERDQITEYYIEWIKARCQ
ncbi:Alpha/Beta hydrolase protein, partial [Sporodiniella umbellata]